MVSVLCNLNIQTLHYDCLHIEDVQLLSCAHLINSFSFLRWEAELRHFTSEMLRWYLGCIVCNSNSFQTLHIDCLHIENVHLLFCAHLMIFFYILGSV